MLVFCDRIATPSSAVRLNVVVLGIALRLAVILCARFLRTEPFTIQSRERVVGQQLLAELFVLLGLTVRNGNYRYSLFFVFSPRVMGIYVES